MTRVDNEELLEREIVGEEVGGKGYRGGGMTDSQWVTARLHLSLFNLPTERRSGSLAADNTGKWNRSAVQTG